MGTNLKELQDMEGAIEDMCFRKIDFVQSVEEELAVAEALHNGVNGLLALAWKYGFSEMLSVALYPSVVRGEKLTADEIIRQQLNASTCGDAFADSLVHMADRLRKSPGVCGAEALR